MGFRAWDLGGHGRPALLLSLRFWETRLDWYRPENRSAGQHNSSAIAPADFAHPSVRRLGLDLATIAAEGNR